MARHRKNARPAIDGTWKRRPPSPFLTDDPKSPGKHIPVDDEANYQRIVSSDPDGYAAVGRAFSTVPLAHQRKRPQPADTVREYLAAPDGVDAIDVGALLDAAVDLMRLVYDVIFAAGDNQGDLFNFERAAAMQFIEAARSLVEGREKAREMADQVLEADELAAIFEKTSSGWGTRRVAKSEADRLNREEIRLLDEQRTLLAEFFKRRAIAVGEIEEYVLCGWEVRERGGPRKAATELLDDLGRGGESTTQKDAGRISPLFLQRALNLAFPSDVTNPETVARCFGAFASSVFQTHGSTKNSTHIVGHPPAEEEARLRMSSRNFHKAFLVRERYVQAQRGTTPGAPGEAKPVVTPNPPSDEPAGSSGSR